MALKYFFKNKFLRAIILPIIKVFAIDFKIKHHWTGDDFHLNSFLHKGYWFHGKSRENFEMRVIAALVKPGDTVVEVGAHIGYLSLWFAKCADVSEKKGELYVFEPGLNNPPYLRKNIEPLGVKPIPAGCGDIDGNKIFYMDNMSGQNNSFLEGMHSFNTNLEHGAFTGKGEVVSEEVKIIRLDTYFSKMKPDFVKIDTEGFDFYVFKGAEGLIRDGVKPPLFMFEATRDFSEIYDWLTSRDYFVFSNNGSQIKSREEMATAGNLNFFAFNSNYHSKEIDIFSNI